MKIPTGKTPIMVSFPDNYPGFTQTSCHTCSAILFDQLENIDEVERMEGYIICPACALSIKHEHPELFPAFEGQLWEGEMRKVEDVVLDERGQHFMDVMQKLTRSQ